MSLPLFNTKIYEKKVITIEKIMVDKALLSVTELCSYLGIGETKARELLRGHHGFGVKIGNRWYANKKRLDAWIDQESV